MLKEKLEIIRQYLINKYRTKIVIVESNRSLQVFRVSALQKHDSKEIMWIVVEPHHIACVADKHYKNDLIAMGFTDIHNSTSEHIAGYIYEKDLSLDRR